MYQVSEKDFNSCWFHCERCLILKRWNILKKKDILIIQRNTSIIVFLRYLKPAIDVKMKFLPHHNHYVEGISLAWLAKLFKTMQTCISKIQFTESFLQVWSQLFCVMLSLFGFIWTICMFTAFSQSYNRYSLFIALNEIPWTRYRPKYNKLWHSISPTLCTNL